MGRDAMLTISESTFAAMTREHMLERVHRCLGEKTADPRMLGLLASPAACFDFWRPAYARFPNVTEHGIAVRLAYLLAAQAHGFEPRLADVAGADAETAMKARLEDAGILPFNAFDPD
jgi:hypothetical protein